MMVLLVDDDSDDRLLLKEFLQACGHEVNEAANGEEGLRQAALARPDVICSDVLMPKMDGLLFLQNLKKDAALRDIPVILYTAKFTREEEKRFAGSLGGCAYLVRPDTVGEFHVLLQGAIDHCRVAGLPAGDVSAYVNSDACFATYGRIISAKLEEKVRELQEAIKGRTEAEQRLQEQRDFLQNALDALTHPFYVINAADYTIKLANRAASHLGVWQSGATCYELTHRRSEPCREDEHPCPLAEIRRTKQPVVVEHVHQDQAGRETTHEIHAYPVFDTGGELCQIIEYCLDVSARKAVEEERRRLVTAIEQGADSIIMTDRHGIIQYVNPAFTAITGYAREEAIGRNPRILKSGEHDERFYKEMWQTLAAGKVWRGRLVNRKKDGSLFDEEAVISPVLNEKGEVINYVAVKRDVTEQVRLGRQLRQAQKMEAIGTLAGGIAHDFNNILTAILGYSELAMQRMTPESPERQDLREVFNAGKRAQELVKQILTFGRQAEQELRPLILQPVIKEALKLLRSSLPTTIEIQQDIDAGCGKVLADPTQIHQIIMNLCTNAYHAMREQGGVLRVSLSPVAAASMLLPTESGARPPGYVKLAISDTGVGMKPALLEKIFEPYFTTKGKGEGTGLGLSVVHGIVKSHGGQIDVQSQPGLGSTFSVYLPLAEPMTAEGPAAKAEEPVRRGSERLMVVDDEEYIRQISQRSLEHLGYKVTTLADGEAALQLFRKDPQAFALVITDMTMPKMTGIELARQLLAVRPDLPIILCTGYSSLINEEEAKQIGIREFLLKPVSLNNLAGVIRRVIEHQ